MNLSLIRSMTRSAVFELENDLCYRPAHPFTVTLNGRTVYEACNTNVFSLFSLLPGTEYTVGVQAEGESLTCTCLLYTSDAADEEDSGDFGGRRIIKKKKDEKKKKKTSEHRRKSRER